MADKKKQKTKWDESIEASEKLPEGKPLNSLAGKTVEERLKSKENALEARKKKQAKRKILFGDFAEYKKKVDAKLRKQEAARVKKQEEAKKEKKPKEE